MGVTLEKKITVLSSWAPPMIGGPVFLYNLLSQLPSDRYHILTDSRLMATGIDPSTWLAGQYAFVDRPHISRSDISAQAEINAPHIKDIPKNTPAELGLSNWIIWRITNVRFLIPLVRLASICKSIWFFIRAFKHVQKTHSTVLLGISDNGPALIATYLLSRFYHLPYCYYIYDLYRGNNFAPTDRWLAKRIERRLLSQAYRVIVNNEGTVEHYRKLYGSSLKIELIHNSQFTEKYSLRPDSYSIKPPYEIIFTGNISWAQEGGLHNLLKAASLLTDLPITFTIYTNRPPQTIVAEAALHPNVRLTYAPHNEMPAIQSRAALLFLPLAWNTPGPDIIATATPGKFTDYLAVGRPMLIHAPDYSFVSKYGKQNNLGLVVDHNDPKLLADAIRNFLSHPEIGRLYVNNSIQIFMRNHDARKSAEKLVQIFNSI